MAKGMSFKVLLQLQAKEFQKGINNIKRQLEGFGRFVKNAFALGSITMFGRQMVQVGKDFEDAMARVQAVSNATTEEFKKMQAEAQRLGSTTRYTATEAAGALENLTRNGMSAAQATKALASVLQLAQANSVGLAEAANIITNTLNMFNLSVEQAGRVNDVLSSTASHAATDLTSLYEALTNAAPAANVLGFSIEEVSSAIGALAQRGVKGAEAGTKLRIAFQKMADPKVIAKMKEQGIEIDETTMKSEGLLKTVQKLSKANLSLGQLGNIFDAKSAMAVQMLIASLGDLETMLGVTANSAGETERMFNQSVGSVQKELDSLKSMYEGLLISISQKTSGAVKGVVRLLQNLIINFDTVGGTIMNIASVVVPLLTNRLIAFGKTAVSTFRQVAAGAVTVKAALGGWVSIIATVVTWVGTALVGAWNRANQAMRDAKKHMAEVERAGKEMQLTIDDLKDRIGDGSNEASLNYAVNKACEMFPQFADAIKSARNEAKKLEDWEILRRELQSIADLQNEIERNKVKKEELKAELTEAGEMFYSDIKPESGFMRFVDQYFRTSTHSDTKNARTRDEVQKLIGNQLKDRGWTNDQIKNLANEMAEAFYEKGGFKSGHSEIGAAKDAVKEILEREKIKIDWTPGSNDWSLMQEWLTSYDPTGSVNGNRSRRRELQTSIIGNTQEEVHRSDSTIRADSYSKLKKGLEGQEKELKENTKTTAEFNRKFAQKVDEFVNNVMALGFTNDSEEAQYANSLYKQYSKYLEEPKPNPGGGDSSSKAKTDSDYISDAIKDYNEAKTKLDNRLAAGTIATEEYNNELDDLEDKTWETITAFSNFESILEKLGQAALGADLKGKYGQNRASEKHEELFSTYGNLAKYLVPANPANEDKNGKVTQAVVDVNFEYRDKLSGMVADLETAIENGDYDLVRGDAIEMLEKLKTAAQEASEEADNLQAKLNLSEAVTKIDEAMQSLSVSSWNTFNTMADVMDRVSSSLMSIAQVFDEDLQDSPFFKAFQAFNSVMNSSIQIMEAVMTVIQLKKQLETKAALEKAKNAAIEVAANKAATTSEVEKAAAAAGAAAAGGASAVASIPIVGPALAVAAAASIAAAILAAMSKFATGGIVGGSSYSGDNNVVRANSGEMILTKAQQKTLFDIANGKSGGKGGQVDFKIHGADLVGVLKNYDRLSR